MFRNMAIAAAYNLARERMPGDAGFARVRPAWEARLRQVRVSRLVAGRRVTNKTLVEAVEVLELARSGLSSSVPGTVLNDPEAAVRLVDRVVRGRLPASVAPARRGDAPAASLALAGDAPDFPLAYHALSAGFLARAIELLGPRAPGRGRRRLQEMLAASWALAGPDGDVAYSGRSQEQIWALSLTAYAAEFERRSSGNADLGAVADRATARIGRDHRGGPAVFAITPALAQNLPGGSRGVDSYVSAVQYTGLGLVGLNWAHDAARRGPGAGAIGSDREGAFVIGKGRARFATVRAGDSWFVVRQAPGREGDLRYDFGLVALKQRAADGTWRDVLPIRPVSPTRGDSAGPLLLGAHGAAVPEGRSLRVGADGTVTVKGGFRGEDRKGVRFAFRPVRCGVALQLPARSGDRYEYHAFVRGRSLTEPLGDAVQQLSFRPTPTASGAGRYSSGTDPLLARVRLRFAPRANEQVAITTCARNSP
jgi:hypothetical protein